MKRLLAYDRQTDNQSKLTDLLQLNKEEAYVEEVVSISDVFRKLAFGKKESLSEERNSLLVVRPNIPDMEILDFLGYLHKSKPSLKIILYTSESGEWLEKLNLVTGKPLIPVSIIITTKINEAVRSLLVLKELNVQQH